MTPRRRRLARAVGIAAVACMLVAAAFAVTLQTQLVQPPASRLVLDRHEAVLAEVPGGVHDDELGYWPMPWVLPSRLVIATRETEDRFFYEHRGVRWQSVYRALRQNLAARRVISGASTIAMQVARMQSHRPRGFVAKAQEAVEALVLVDRYGHDDVMRQYLTLAPYGNRVHGAARAARIYFDKPVEDLSWLQAAFLAALPQAPARMDPWDDKGRWRGLQRAHRILQTLHARGFLDTHDLDVALHSELGVVARPVRPPDAIHAALAWSARAKDKNSTTLHATLDLEMQSSVARIVQQNLQQVRDRGATNASAIVVDTASGDILAWVGSADYFDEEAHGAIDFNLARRSPGSTLKPFVYALALQNRALTAATPLADIPLDLVDDGGRSYLPRNINQTYIGPLSLREALANSRNVPALRVLSDVGVERALDVLERGGVAGISHEPGHYGLGLAIGNLHVTPVELAGLYRALARHGMYRPLRFFVDDDDGSAREQRLVSEEAADLVAHILADDTARQPSFPAGSALEYDYAVAIKTGTSQGFRDGWTAAFSDRLVVVAWVGNHDWRRMNNLGGLAGTADAVHAILDAWQPRIHRQDPIALQMPGPADARAVSVCALSGMRAGPECPHARRELFLPGTEPEEVCTWHRRAQVDVRNGMLATSSCPSRYVRARTVVALPPVFERWARREHLLLAPVDDSPLCGGAPIRRASTDIASVVVVDPPDGLRLTWEPDTPPQYATLRLVAEVTPADEEIVFLVDGTPVAQVGFPHEARWTVVPGAHTIQAAFARRHEASTPVHIAVRR